jgi:hypothetical protein
MKARIDDQSPESRPFGTYRVTCKMGSTASLAVCPMRRRKLVMSSSGGGGTVGAAALELHLLRGRCRERHGNERAAAAPPAGGLAAQLAAAAWSQCSWLVAQDADDGVVRLPRDGKLHGWAGRHLAAGRYHVGTSRRAGGTSPGMKSRPLTSHSTQLAPPLHSVVASQTAYVLPGPSWARCGR